MDFEPLLSRPRRLHRQLREWTGGV